jgi:hypothetical protein
MPHIYDYKISELNSLYNILKNCLVPAKYSKDDTKFVIQYIHDTLDFYVKLRDKDINHDI